MQKKNKQKAKHIYKKVSTIIVGCVMLLTMLAFVSSLIQIVGGKKPSLFGYRFYYIITDSMSPKLEVNDVILSETLSGADEVRQRLKTGDVVTFVAEYGIQKGMLITHEVVRTAYFDDGYGKEMIQTRGVKEGATDDPPVPLENVQAVMVTEIPIIGSLYRFIMSGVGLVLLIVLPLSAIILIMALKLIRQVKHSKTPPSPPGQDPADIARKAVEEYIAKKAIEDYTKKKK
ncbi:MAG: signal peptidase I [Clostridia bacterium]|nr:signal peptidase I [Clostridia bacterium]